MPVRSARFLVSAFAALALLGGCRSDTLTAPTRTPPPPAVAQVSDDVLRARLVAMGYRAADIVDAGNAFTVQGDMIFPKAALSASIARSSSSAALHPTAPNHQYYGGIVGRGAYLTNNPDGQVLVQMDLSELDAENPTWAGIFREAITQWNAIPGSAIVFAEAPPGVAHVVVSMGELSDCQTTKTGTLGCGYPPVYQCQSTDVFCYDTMGDRIYVIRSPYLPNMPGGLGVATHEMGHVLGLQHTDFYNIPCGTNYTSRCTEEGTAVLVPGTPSSSPYVPGDAASVMQSQVMPFSSFSYFDRVAVRYLYPGGAGPTPTNSLSGTSAVISWPAMQDAIGYEVYTSVQTGGCSWVCFSYDSPPSYTDTLVGTTTDTTFVDSSRQFVAPEYGWCFTGAINYRIRTVFANGARSNPGPMTTACSP